MSDIIQKCCVCENDFRPGSLGKDGKCVSCQKAFPTVKTKAEAMALNRPEIHLGEKVTADTVRQIVKEELNEFKAVLKAEQKVDNMAKARAAKDGKKISNTEILPLDRWRLAGKKNEDNDGGAE